ncbi:hypothetical protein PF327_10895 [Sulfurovum sp. XTW-4]|uniref:Helix-turn-helix domain-containing protein n=1 Tax=Sulfurovum xiamenensis TaxID=3019066 RepID=A0ABT7QUE1_9BACT|nr:helix-turn-helix domain-containing protein [Sulfurovum xiamenensis]MDM5264702.1 hypothetical protein [Sulfurovum xiamenensis]
MNYKQDQKPLKNYRLTGMRKKALQMMQGGIRLSELKGLRMGLGSSLRTRISELRAMGYDIRDEFVKAPSGARFKEYFMVVSK